VLDVLEHLEGIVRKRYLFGPQKPGLSLPPGIEPLSAWRHALPELFV
jgi:hypothetical protein